jgi:hypothetical protein
MREHTWDERRDHAVHLLAQLSLIVVLAVLGALFVGSAATSDASEPSGRPSSAQTVRDQARPVGLLLGAVVMGGGLVVLVIGALKPPARTEHREYAELLDR